MSKGSGSTEGSGGEREAQMTAEETEVAKARERRAQARQQAAADAAERRGVQRKQQQQRQQRQMKEGLAQSGLAWFFSTEAMVVFGRNATGNRQRQRQ